MRYLFCVLALVGLLVGVSYAADPATAPAPTNPLSLQLNCDVTTQSIFRGVNLESKGVILTPGAFARYDLGVQQQGVFDSLAITGSFTNIVQSQDSQAWAEADFTAGLEAGIFKRFTLYAGYAAYVSPHGNFDTVHELDFSVAFNDADLWKDTPLTKVGFTGIRPYVLYALELDGSRAASSPGSYLETGVNPGITLFDIPDHQITLSFPTAVGFSVDNYYGDGGGYAYTSTGPMLNIPLTKQLSVHGGLTAYFLGDKADQFNGGSDFELVGSAGLTLKF